MRLIHHNKKDLIENRDEIEDLKPKLLLEVGGCIIHAEKELGWLRWTADIHRFATGVF